MGRMRHETLFKTLELRMPKDVFVLNSAVSRCAKHGWSEALDMMHRLGHVVNLVACNAVIGSCIGRWQLASQLASAQSLKVDVVTYTSVVQTCKKSLQWQNAIEHCECAGQSHVKIDMILLCAAASCLSDSQKMEHWNQALEVLSWRNGFSEPMHPDSFALSLSIKAFRTGRTWQRASFVLENHHIQRLVPTTLSFNTVLGALGAHWQQGLLMANVKPEVPADSATHNTLISILGPWTAAGQLLQTLNSNRLATNVVTHNAVMAAFDKQGLWEQSHLLLWNMPHVHLLPDMFSFNTAMGCQWQLACLLLYSLSSHSFHADPTSRSRCINSCAAWPDALELLGGGSREQMLRKSRSSSKISQDVFQSRHDHLIEVSAAASVCARASQLVKAEQLLRREEQLSSADVVLFNVVMSSFGSAGRWQEVQAMLRRLQNSALRPQVVSFNAAISSFDRGQRWKQGSLLLEELRLRNIQCTTVTFNSAISASQGGWRTSLWLVDELQQHLPPNSVTYNTLVGAFGPGSLWERAIACVRLLNTQRGMQVDAISCSSAVASCSKKWRLAWLLLENTWQAQVPPNHVIAGGTSSLDNDLFGIFRHSLWRETSKMLELLQQRNAETNTLALSCVVVVCEKGDGHKHLLQGLCAIDNYSCRGLQQLTKISCCSSGQIPSRPLEFDAFVSI